MTKHVIPNRPDFFIRFSSQLFLAIIILLIALAWHIHYPKIIVGKAVVVYSRDQRTYQYAELIIKKKFFNDLKDVDKLQCFFDKLPFKQIGYRWYKFKFISEEDIFDSFRIRIDFDSSGEVLINRPPFIQNITTGYFIKVKNTRLGGIIMEGI